MLQFESYPSFSFSARMIMDETWWTCTILSLDVCDGYYRITLDTSRRKVTFLCGNGGYHWIFFPHRGVGTELGNFSDFEYNLMKLGKYFDHITCMSILYCLTNVENFVHRIHKK